MLLNHPSARAWLAGASRPQAPGQVADPAAAKFLDLQLRKRAAEVEALETRNQRLAGLLVSKALVQKHCIGWLERASHRLLGAVPRAASGRLVHVNITVEDGAKVVRDLISAELENAQKFVVDALRSRTTLAASENPPELENG